MIKKKVVSLLVVIMAILDNSPRSVADEYDYSGNKWLPICESGYRHESGYGPFDPCLYFIMGYVAGAVNSADGKHFCLPDKSTWSQIEIVVIKHMRENPDKLHYPFWVLIHNALSASYPCGNKQ